MKTAHSLIFALLISTALSAASARAAVCPDTPEVTVLSENGGEIHDICLSAARALAILEGFGLPPRRQITIKITDGELHNDDYMAYGTYDSRSDIIELMSQAAIRRLHERPVMYDEEFDAVHYQGAVAHEITHAVYHQHSSNLSPGTAPQEYLAHAVQLASLPPERRQRIITAKDVAAWESGDAISDIYMALEPTGFAVKSYKHLSATENPREFIDILLNSKWFYVYIP